MKKIIGIVMVMTTAWVYAADTAQETVVDEFFRVAKVKEKYEVGLTAGFDAGSGMTDLSGIPEAQRTQFEEMQKKIKAMMLQEMGWDKVKADYAKLYLSVYNENELAEVTKLLKTSVGQKMINNELKLMPKAMLIGQEKAKELMPKIMQMSMEAMMPQGGPPALR